MRVFRIAIAALLIALALPTAAQERPDPELVELLRQAANDTNSFTDYFDAQVWLTDMSARLTWAVKAR